MTMHELNITDFPGNAFATAKALRQSALKWQMLALSAQAKAIQAIADEHHITLTDVDLPNLVAGCDDLVKSATSLCNEVGSLEPVETLRRIVALRFIADDLRDRAKNFVRIADQRAHFRLSSLLPVLFEHDSDPLSADESKENDRLVNDSDKLAVGAGARCYRAESEQHGTFALQVNSICDLALEMVLADASDFAKKPTE
jgi:hypothetical protein